VAAANIVLGIPKLLMVFSGAYRRIGLEQAILMRRGKAAEDRQPRRSKAARRRAICCSRRPCDFLEHDPEKLTDFSDKIMRQNKDVDVAHDPT
jgi:hypothetical protein